MIQSSGWSTKLLAWANKRGERLEQALPRLIEERQNVLEVAREIGVTPAVIYRWLRLNNLRIAHRVVSADRHGATS